MGNDDNSPLSGVTGGGLPAEIWHEVMVRIENGLPMQPLPMIVPPPRVPPTGAAGEQGVGGDQPARQQQQGVAEKILSDVLHSLGAKRN